MTRPSRRFALALAATLALAFGDELQQTLVSARSVELQDVLANLCGLALGVVAVRSDWPRSRRLPLAAVALVVAAVLAGDSYLRLRDYNRGMLYEEQREFGLARQSYLRALASGLHSHGLYNSLGWVEIESGEGDPARAVEYARRALDMQPEDADTMDTYGWALHHVGRSVEALDYLREALARKPAIYCVHYHLGVVYLSLGDRERAMTHFRAQIDRFPMADESRRARDAIIVGAH